MKRGSRTTGEQVTQIAPYNTSKQKPHPGQRPTTRTCTRPSINYSPRLKELPQVGAYELLNPPLTEGVPGNYPITQPSQTEKPVTAEAT